MTTHQHYHRDDYPHTLALITALVGHRQDLDALGVEITAHGASIDFDTLATAPTLSTTERHTAQAAQGLAGLEHHGGTLPNRLAHPFRALTTKVLR
jgi:hypothetical protein